MLTANKLYYYGARYYDPKTSVFLRVDPMADKFPQTSPFSYCSNNPIIKIDPDGKEEEWVEGTNGKPYWNPEVTKTDQSKLKPGERYIGPTYTHINDNGSTEYGAQDGNKYNSVSLYGVEVKPESNNKSIEDNKPLISGPCSNSFENIIAAIDRFDDKFNGSKWTEDQRDFFKGLVDIMLELNPITSVPLDAIKIITGTDIDTNVPLSNNEYAKAIIGLATVGFSHKVEFLLKFVLSPTPAK
ncbi:MAG TPA: RHS repeat-associated core domain-containing protein [Bacteroidales bacterium]|nr:RHS repeat-associated core domain-containing protein [Bacteroidales bacterium]HSA43369.1 RHS repeat-associated core domain-containing protein [Bacteroidales bacterium]